jgi:hypothetical protein
LPTWIPSLPKATSLISSFLRLSNISALADGDRMQFDRLKRREFITLLGGAISWSATSAATYLAPKPKSLKWDSKNERCPA